MDSEARNQQHTGFSPFIWHNDECFTWHMSCTPAKRQTRSSCIMLDLIWSVERSRTEDSDYSATVGFCIPRAM